MAMILKITDGTVTIDFASSGTGYRLKYDGGWAPNVATRRQSRVGGLIYNDVTESLRITIEGSTPADALAKLDALSDLLDQASAWSSGATVDCVTIQYLPEGSSRSTAVAAEIVGPGQQGFLRLPNNFVRSGGRSIISDIQLTVRRRGLWLGDEETRTNSIDTQFGGSPDMHTPLITETFSTVARVPSPYSATLSFDTNGNLYQPAQGFLLFANGSNAFQWIEAEDMSLGTNLGSVTFATEAATDASGGTVRKLANHGTDNYLVAFASPGMSNAEMVAIFAVMRLHNTGEYVDMYAYISTLSYNEADYSGDNTIQYTPVSRISGRPFNEDDKMVVFLGMVAKAAPASATVGLYVQPSLASGTGAPTFYLDGLALVAVDEMTSIIAVDNVAIGADIVISNNALDKLTPEINLGNYDGLVSLNMTGEQVSCFPLLVGKYHVHSVRGAQPSTYRPLDDDRLDGTQDPFTASLSVTRREAFLTPQ